MKTVVSASLLQSSVSHDLMLKKKIIII